MDASDPAPQSIELGPELHSTADWQNLITTRTLGEP